MRTATVIALLASIVLAVPAGAAAQRRADDERVRQDAAALPERLWKPGADPVSAAGPALPEDGGRVSPLLTVLFILGAVGAGYVVSLLQPSGVRQAAAPAPAPAREPEPVPEPEPQREPMLVAPAPLPVVHDPDLVSESCVIALSHAWGRGHFDVRVEDEGGGHRVVARSLTFDVPRGMEILETGAAGQAHRRLLLHLVAAGWRLEPAEAGPWYERRLSRPVDEQGGREVDRALVSTRSEGGEAEFVALALDEYGNAQVMARSPRFDRRAGRPLEESEPAAAAYGTLLEDLEAHGWRVLGTLDSWYGATLARRRRR